MPPESAIDQALLLKKRARRRLVGAIALVLMMLVILPNVLQDRTALEKRAPITLTMPAPEVSHQEIANVTPAQAVEASPSEKSSQAVISTDSLPDQIADHHASSADSAIPVDVEAPKLAPSKMAEKKSIKSEQEKKSASQPAETKKTIVNQPAKVDETKPQRFLIQIGVYSDEANVKQLQAKISEAGFSSRTAKLKTEKGEKIRLRVGSFVTRDAAAEALKKLQNSGLSGMVLIDE